MTRKDFEAIAAAVQQARADAESHCGLVSLAVLSDALASHCTQANPNFDRARFLRACGVV